MDTNLSTQDMLRRKSVRKYRSEWNEEYQWRVMQAAYAATPLVEGIKLRFLEIPCENMSGRTDAPSYTAIYSEEKEGWQENAGYMLYQWMLILSKNGIGSVPLSGMKPKVDPAKAAGLSLVIMMSAGLPGEELYCDPLEEKKRKTMGEICSNAEERSLIEYARIAPSSGNAQPWYFTGDDTRIDIFAQLAGDQFNTSNTELKLLDVGIACCALNIAAQEAGYDGEFLVDVLGSKKPVPKGYEYDRTLFLVK